jgi:hypothetical protein
MGFYHIIYACFLVLILPLMGQKSTAILMQLHSNSLKILNHRQKQSDPLRKEYNHHVFATEISVKATLTVK